MMVLIRCVSVPFVKRLHSMRMHCYVISVKMGLFGKSTKYFSWTFSSFCFISVGSNAAQINVSDKSYGCVKGILAN